MVNVPHPWNLTQTCAFEEKHFGGKRKEKGYSCHTQFLLDTFKHCPSHRESSFSISCQTLLFPQEVISLTSPVFFDLFNEIFKPVSTELPMSVPSSPRTSCQHPETQAAMGHCCLMPRHSQFAQKPSVKQKENEMLMLIVNWTNQTRTGTHWTHPESETSGKGNWQEFLLRL